MWEQQSGTKLDGAVAMDPIALSYLLKATGPISRYADDARRAGRIVA